MTGFTGVIWDARTTAQLASDLGDGAGPAPLVEAGAGWAQLAAELGSAAAEYGAILGALGIHWDSSHTSTILERLSRLGPWFAEAAEAAGGNAARAEAQAAAVAVARLTMPDLAEVDLAEQARRVATTVSALAPALVGAAAQAERAVHDQRMRAARVMQTYESASESAARPWPSGPPAPDLVSGHPLAAERAARAAQARPSASPAKAGTAEPVGTSPVGVPMTVAASPPAKTSYAPTILAGGSAVNSSAPTTPAPTGHTAPGAPVAPPPAQGAASAERVVARGPAGPEQPDEQEPSAAAGDAPATWAELAVADRTAVQPLTHVDGGTTVDPRYLNETLILDQGTGT